MMKRKTFSCTTILSAVGVSVLLILVTGFQKNDSNNTVYTNSQVTEKTVSDIDGNAYHTVTIGDQVWMAENLKTTHYNDGSPIPNVTEDTVWSRLTTGAYCWYNNDSATYRNTYGALYNFHAVNNGRNLCPKGWHVPTESEWLALETYLGGRSAAGGKMKEILTTYWDSSDTSVTNESGVCGFLGGGRARLGWFGDVGVYGTWWSSTGYDSNYAWHWGLSRGSASVRSNPGHMASGFSVRCVKD